MAVPLQTSERVIGLIYLDSPGQVLEFSPDDLNLLSVMANVAAIRIEHARLAEVEAAEQAMQRELEQAAEIQRRLLPASAPVIPGWDLAGYNAACRTVGGDYYDFFAYGEDGKFALVVGDVAGKGMPAAMLMSSLQARVQVLSELGPPVAQFVARLNKTISANCPMNRFITFFAGVLDPATGELSYCNAGHNPPLLVRANGDVEMLEGGGMILGILGMARYEQFTAQLNPGDVLVAFSDGVTEAPAPNVDEEFGEIRLADTIKAGAHEHAIGLIEGINRVLIEWTHGGVTHDDVTLVVVKRGQS
jgi:serine phosphatase RsbU (regulator of sigma subunit)